MSIKGEVKIGDYVTTARYRERMRVVKAYRGSWTLKPMLECKHSLFDFTITIYVEDVINHFPKRF